MSARSHGVVEACSWVAIEAAIRYSSTPETWRKHRPILITSAAFSPVSDVSKWLRAHPGAHLDEATSCRPADVVAAAPQQD